MWTTPVKLAHHRSFPPGRPSRSSAAVRQMGRPKKAAVASRANGGRAKNKGTRVCKPIWMLHVRYEYDLRPPYYTVLARPQTYADIGKLNYVKPSDIAEKELKVFEFCCRNEKRVRFALGASDKKQRLAVVRAEKRQEEAARHTGKGGAAVQSVRRHGYIGEIGQTEEDYARLRAPDSLPRPGRRVM